MPHTNRELYSTTRIERSREEWHDIAQQLLNELSIELGTALTETNFFMEDQTPNESSTSCHIDFTGLYDQLLNLRVCGILGYSINWNEAAFIGAHLFLYRDEQRIYHNDGINTTFYSTRNPDGWSKAIVDHGYGPEWEGYEDPGRWTTKA